MAYGQFAIDATQISKIAEAISAFELATTVNVALFRSQTSQMLNNLDNETRTESIAAVIVSKSYLGVLTNLAFQCLVHTNSRDKYAAPGSKYNW